VTLCNLVCHDNRFHGKTLCYRGTFVYKPMVDFLRSEKHHWWWKGENAKINVPDAK